jgi:hypothetical protein
MWLVAVLWACGSSYNPAREAIDAAKAAEVQPSHGGWTCPMHPEVHEEEPVPCPICGMALVKEES